IEDFIKIFCDKPKHYQIVFRSTKDVDLYKDSLKAFDIKLVNDLHDLDIDHSKHKFPKSENEVYICVSEIKARDNFS
ncbi:hypothetical protein, partial [Vibrio parahaemolyticus]